MVSPTLFKANCAACAKPVGDREVRHVVFFCDENPSSVWCGECFAATLCGEGEHGEDCPTRCECEAIPEPPKPKVQQPRGPRKAKPRYHFRRPRAGHWGE